MIIEFASFGGYTFALGFHESVGLALMGSGCTQAVYHAQDMDFSSNLFASKRHSPNQQALNDLVKGNEKKDFRMLMLILCLNGRTNTIFQHAMIEVKTTGLVVNIYILYL